VGTGGRLLTALSLVRFQPPELSTEETFSVGNALRGVPPLGQTGVRLAKRVPDKFSKAQRLEFIGNARVSISDPLWAFEEGLS
ncbi:MAG: hypothetical protein KDA84_06545, partial [Planctomycetaceae bacterium]|nr:hypothetical protein [Planctomycetaceae bacterium]